jgi:hypothetical protein
VERDRLTFELARREHAELLAIRMRKADAAEILASGGYRPLPGLLAALEWSRRYGQAWCGLIDGAPAALFGVGKRTLLSPCANPWLLTGDLVERSPRLFWRASKAVVATWLEEFDELEQHVDARYTQALRWAARLGFTVGPAEPFGRRGAPFCRIHLRRPDHV